jgi:hypothetical protein
VPTAHKQGTENNLKAATIKILGPTPENKRLLGDIKRELQRLSNLAEKPVDFIQIVNDIRNRRFAFNLEPGQGWTPIGFDPVALGYKKAVD